MPHLHLVRSDKAPKKFHSTDELIEAWLADRQELLLILYKLSVIKPSTYSPPIGNLVKEFLELLVDYVSQGHFELFEKLSDQCQENNDATPIQELMVNILKSTLDVLDFNDKYENNTNYNTLTPDLSNLGEALATRFDHEDDLINLYLKKTT